MRLTFKAKSKFVWLDREGEFKYNIIYNTFCYYYRHNTNVDNNLKILTSSHKYSNKRIYFICG